MVLLISENKKNKKKALESWRQAKTNAVTIYRLCDTSCIKTYSFRALDTPAPHLFLDRYLHSTNILRLRHSPSLACASK
jgi:hypothetical protein